MGSIQQCSRSACCACIQRWCNQTQAVAEGVSKDSLPRSASWRRSHRVQRVGPALHDPLDWPRAIAAGPSPILRAGGGSNPPAAERGDGGRRRARCRRAAPHSRSRQARPQLLASTKPPQQPQAGCFRQGAALAPQALNRWPHPYVRCASVLMKLMGCGKPVVVGDRAKGREEAAAAAAAAQHGGCCDSFAVAEVGCHSSVGALVSPPC